MIYHLIEQSPELLIAASGFECISGMMLGVRKSLVRTVSSLRVF